MELSDLIIKTNLRGYSSMSFKIGIIGVTGYTGGELIRLLLNHPQVEIVAASSRSNVGKQVSEVHHHLYQQLDLIECETDSFENTKIRKIRQNKEFEPKSF